MFAKNSNGLTIDAAFEAKFPAIFNAVPASRVSEGYQSYRSDKIIDQMLANGMKLVEASQQKARMRDPRHQLHMMRFRPDHIEAKFRAFDSTPEIVILNGHDGRNAFRALAGVFRFVCSNGMIASDMDLGAISKRRSP